MAQVEVLSQESKPEDTPATQTDLVVAIPVPLGTELLASLVGKLSDACHQLASPYRVLLALPGDATQELPAELPASSPTAYPLRYLNYPAPASDSAALPWLTNAATSRLIFSLAKNVDAKACTVFGMDPGLNRASLTVERLALLLEPGMEGNFDLVMPLYTVEPFDDLLNKSILYPLTRALYGRRVRNPLGNEFQASSRLFQGLASNGGKDSARQQGRLLWLASTAANQNLRICQVQLGTRIPQSHEGIELSDALAQLAGPLFTDMEDSAAYWQRVRGSHEVPTFGNCEASANTPDAVDVRRMVDAFQLGVRNLREIWALILPPVTLLELKKLSQLGADEFHLPDALWARILYDFALAHRLRNIHRNHLFGALTPLYLGWVASYAVVVNRMGMATAEERVEELARTCEAEKPYLLSRWRWPDRFHP